MAEETLGKKVFTNPKDLTLSNIREMIADGDIKPNPDYQRDYIYNDKQASKLIESFLIGIPIPTVYLCETEDECKTRQSNFNMWIRNRNVNCCK